LFAFGQAARWDYQVTTINQSAPQPGGMYPVLAIPGSAVQICNAPVNAVPCTNYATTYTSATMTTACPSNAQFTRPGSNVCVANADAQGGFGFWSSAGIYQYTVTTTYGSSGPYDLTTSSGQAFGCTGAFGNLTCTGTVAAGAMVGVVAGSAGNTLYAGPPYPYFLSVESDSNGRDSELEETPTNGMVGQLVSHILGVNYITNETEYCYSPGDCIPHISEAYGNGVSAEQNEGMDWHIRLQENGYVYQGTANSISCSSSPVVCTFNMTQTQGQPQPQFGIKGNLGLPLGEGTQLIDITNGYSTGTITNIPNAGGPGCCGPTLTGTGVNWDSYFGDTFAQAVTSAAIDNGGGNNTFPKTNVTVPTGTWTGTFTVSATPVCFFDESDTRYQCAKVTAVSTNASITVDRLNWPITTGAAVAQGGLTGYCLGLDLDTVTSSSRLGYGNPTDSQVVNPIRRCQPIQYNTSGNTLTLYVNTSGESQFTTVANPSQGSVTYHIYPQTMIATVLNSSTGLVDGNNVKTTPFVGTFTNGDTLESPHYFASKAGGLNWSSNTWQSAPGWTYSFGFSTGGAGADKGAPQGSLYNDNDPRMYFGLPSGISESTTPGYGNMSSIGGYALNGPYAYGLTMNTPPFGEYNNMGAVYVGCGGPFNLNSWCQSWNQAVYLLTAQNRGGVSGSQYPYAEDSLSYNPYSYTWSVTAGGINPNGGGNTCTQQWTPNGWTQSGADCSTVGQGMPLLAPIAVSSNIDTAFNVGTTAPAGLNPNTFGLGWTDLANGAQAGYSWWQGPGKNSGGSLAKYNIVNSGGNGWMFCTYETGGGPVTISTPSQLNTCHQLNSYELGTGTFDTIVTASAPMPADSIPFVPGLNSVLSYIPSPTVNGTYVAGWNVTAGSAVAPTAINLSGGSGVVSSGTQWSPAYYAATGAVVSGTTPFTGFQYWSGSGAPAAGTATQMSTLLQSLTGCSTATWLLSPADNVCHAPGGGGAVSSVSNSDGTLTISPTTGAVVASLALNHANTWSALQTFGTNISIGGVTPTGATGTGNNVFATAPTITGASVNGVTLTTGGSSSTYLNGAGSYSTPSGGGSGLSGMTAGQVPLAATSSTVTSSIGIQGTDTSLFSSGIISGTGASLCTDANGGATTTGCPGGSMTWPANAGYALWLSGTAWTAPAITSPSTSVVEAAAGAAANLTVQGGQDASVNTTQGGITIRGADQTGAGGASSQGGSAFIRGGNNAATNAASDAGNVELLTGASTGASTPGLNGLYLEAHVYDFTGTYAQWGLVCFTATANTVQPCAGSLWNPAGVAVSQPSSTTVEVAMGNSIVPINASAAVTLGYYACTGTTAGKITPAISGCLTGIQIGTVVATTGTWPPYPDGTAFPTLSTTLPLVQMTTFGSVYISGNTSSALTKLSAGGYPTLSPSSVLDAGVDVVSTEPGYFANGNQLNGTTPTAITSTSLATTGIAFPPTYVTTARTYRGECWVVWQQATGVATVQFGINTSLAPTHLTLSSLSYIGTTALPYSTGLTDITSATTTAATASLTPTASATTFITDIKVTLSAAAAANTVTLYGLTSNASDALDIMPGTFCTW
jgi:hypothetical protein